MEETRPLELRLAAGLAIEFSRSGKQIGLLKTAVQEEEAEQDAELPF